MCLFKRGNVIKLYFTSLSMNPIFLLLHASLKFDDIAIQIIVLGHNSRNHHDIIICFDWWANPSMLSAIFIWSFSVFKSLVRQCIAIVSGFYPNTRIYNLNFVPQISRFLLGDVIISSKTNVFCGKNKQKRSNGKVKNKTVLTILSFIWIPRK